MSVNNFLDAVPFSVSGLQNLQVNTINGGGFITNINIAGQIAFLSWNSTTETLTLLIPNASSSITGLLTSTDWNTFNGKENTLTFSSPLTRVGNTISFDFTQSLTFNGNTQTLNNNTIVGGSLFYTGAVSATTPDILYIDNFTGYITKGPAPTPGTNILPLNNVWTGSSNTFENEVIVENLAQLQYAFRAYINKTIHPTLEFFYVEVNGDVGFFGQLNPLYPLPAGGPVWKIGSSGNAVFISANLQNTLVVENSQGAGDAMRIYRDGNNFPTEYLFFNNTGSLGFNPGGWNITSVGDITCRNVNASASITATNSLIVENESNASVPFRVYKKRSADANRYLLFNAPTETLSYQTSAFVNGWSITSNGFYTGSFAQLANGMLAFDRIQVYNDSNRNFLKFSHFEQTPSLSNWIASEFNYDNIDKVVIGNLGLAVPGYGPTIGGHNSGLTAWTDFWVNPGATTYTNILVANQFNYPSDRRIKKEISYLDASKSIKFVKGLKPAKFKKCVDDRIEFLKNEGEKWELGFIAQDIQEIAETESQKMIVSTETYLEKERLTIKPFYIIAELVNANKEMIDKIERLESENKTLLERLEAMELKMKKLVNILGINI